MKPPPAIPSSPKVKEIVPMRKLLIVACCFALSACARNRTDVVSYVPNQNVSEPAKVIERVIKHQSPVYITVPYEVSAKSDCIELRTTEQGGGWVTGGSPGVVASTICYRNIGKIVLNYNNIWYVEVSDRLGNWMCYVYSFDESEAKLFIDAMYTMMAKQ
jgi:hypothetical protein